MQPKKKKKAKTKQNTHSHREQREYHSEHDIRFCQIASGNLLYDAVSSSPRLCDNLEGWDGVGGGSVVQEGVDICIPMVDSCWRVAETNAIL